MNLKKIIIVIIKTIYQHPENLLQSVKCEPLITLMNANIISLLKLRPAQD